MGKTQETLPFVAVAGMETARRALLLLATDPGLKGVLIHAGPGRAKSLLVRAFLSLVSGDGTPVVEAPLGMTEDQLLGGLDLERTLSSGAKQVAGGLLARAHRGFLSLDQANLLDRSLTRHVAAALDSGIVRLEREGASAEFPADFAIVGTCDPAEGAVDPALAESVGIQLHEAGPLSLAERVEMLERVAACQRSPAAFQRQFAEETDRVRERIAAARDLLPRVEIAAHDLRRLVQMSMRMVPESHRADVFAVRCARAHAALHGRKIVVEEDLAAAVRFVLMPRAMDRAPANGAPSPQEHAADSAAPQGPGDDVTIEPVDFEMPEVPVEMPGFAPERGSRRPGRRRGARSRTVSWTRGQFVRAVAGRPGACRVALAATLAAAAPFQMRRRSDSGAPAIRLTTQDLRYKEFRQSAGVLTIFAVDASGSMALSRMAEAKGALIRLLQKAYLHRDHIALIGFRAESAEVLLPPCRSVERAKRALDALRVGGATPLAAGLRAALDLARRDRRMDARRPLLVLLTDGRANAGGGPDIWKELERACAALQAEGVASLVIDNRDRMFASGETERLACWLGGRHVYLPRPGADAVYSTVVQATEAARIR